MKILAFTAGAAQMYCGSCIRDNALAAELKSQGHDVILLPIYTPTLTDETNVSAHKVVFGGISVYLEQHSSLFRNTPALFDKLWDSEWALKLAARRSIPVNARMLGEMTVSMLRGGDGRQRKEVHKLSAWLRTEPAPDIVTLPNSLLIGLARSIREAVHRPILCTLQGEDLFLSQLPEPYLTQALDLIRANIAYVDGFAAVSEYYAGYMCGYLGIPARKMHVVPLGVNLKGYDASLRLHSNCFTVGYFARVAPEKGLHVLADAYVKLRRETDFGGSTLEVAGYLAPEHRLYLKGIERRIKAAGLDHEFRYRGVLDRPHKIDFLRNLDVLSVPATYDEPKGLFLLEAMANGVPVVEPRRGGLTEIVEKTGGGILVEPDDTAALAQGIYSLWKDPALLEQLGKRGVAGVREHYSVACMAARALEVYAAVGQVAT
ncbi:MAG TPA: glycosyltransferase family 4 protein [Bryobacteraceae bacterium]|jgi:glycosyltransferase involved in cell wall biosynthesis|nr:glycosyltransferase family 4 protein [Bryobacteraceae bacterium]